MKCLYTDKTNSKCRRLMHNCATNLGLKQRYCDHDFQANNTDPPPFNAWVTDLLLIYKHLLCSLWSLFLLIWEKAAAPYHRRLRQLWTPACPTSRCSLQKTHVQQHICICIWFKTLNSDIAVRDLGAYPQINQENHSCARLTKELTRLLWWPGSSTTTPCTYFW